MTNVQAMNTSILFPRRNWLLAAALVVGGCSDLATVPDRVPESLIIEPADTMITQGDRAPLRVTVLDQHGDPFPSYPSWAPPRWTFSDPDAVGIAPDGSLEGLGGGEVFLQARLAGLLASSRLLVNPTMVALSAPTIYLVQSVQNPQGDVPIIAGVQALLRVFVSSDPASFYQPTGRATFYLDGAEIHSVTLVPRSYLIPQGVNESRLDRSFNAIIPGSVLQPGTEMVVELDVDGVTPLAPGSQLRIPAEGRMALDVRALPSFELTVVPVLHAASPDERVFNWIASLMTPTSSDLRFLRSVLPIGDLDLEVHETYTTSADLTTDAGWRAFLREISALRVADGSHRNYYGAMVLPPGSAWGGLASIGNPYSVGRPVGSTFAHELGHNLSLRHAPCGGAGGPDPSYPHPGGSIGVWGYEGHSALALGSLKSPNTYKDLMGYCTPRWISDYQFKKAIDFRLQVNASLTSAGQQQVLLLWGSAGDGEMLLEPAFLLDAPPTLPTEDGPYRLEGLDHEGGVLFSLSFAPHEVEWGGGQFAFAVPLGTEGIEALDAISLAGPEGAVTVDRSTRLPRMALSTDDATGRIRAILRDGVGPEAVSENATVRFSEGLPERGPGRRRE